jgi:4-amino-4-deoxy-L-arabinose transferase-like glycosyltransferase
MARSVAPEATIQTAVFQIEIGRGRKIMYWALLVLLAAALSLVYTAGQFRGLDKRESMDMAQLARNIAHGQGFTTYVIRPLSLWQLEHNGWDIRDKATRVKLIMNHPDICNPPLYPLALAGLFKILPAKAFTYDTAEHVYYPERWVMLPFDQLCLFASLLLTYVWAKRLFDRRVAIMATWLMFFSDTLWSYAVSGLLTNFLMLLFLLATYCLFVADGKLNPAAPSEGAPTDSAPAPATGRAALWVLASAVLLGLCFLTRYLAAFFLIPMVIYVMRLFRGWVAAMWAAVYVAVFAAVITPWLVRNHRVSGNALGIARYELVDRTAEFRGETLPRSYNPNFQGAYSMRTLWIKFLTDARVVLLDNLRLVGTDFLVLFFGAGVLYGFRRRDVSRLRGLVLGMITVAILAMSLIGSDPERSGPEVGGGNLLVLLLPIIAIYGTAFFYLLLDRIPFRIKLTRGLAISGFVLLNVSPMIFTLLPPRQALFPYPPYISPVARAVSAQFEPDSLACSDLPWAVAWDGERRTLWIPMTMDDFYEIHDFVAPKGIQYLLLTPYMIDSRPQTEVDKGEFKGWETFLRGQLPTRFPLKAYSPLPPDNEQILLADRARWANQKNAATELESNPFTVPGMTNKPAASPGTTGELPRTMPPAPATPGR